MNKLTKFNQLIKMKDVAFINNLGAEVGEFFLKNDELRGKLYITGSYHSTKNDVDKSINEEINFTILVEDKIIYVEDLDCTAFEYSVIEGTGVKIEFDINLSYEMENLDEDVDRSIDVEEVIIDENSQFEEIDEGEIINEETIISDNACEEIKNNITKEVDEKLSAKLEIVTDNLPSSNGTKEKVISRSFKNETSSLKVVFYSNDKDLEAISKKYNRSIDKIFKTNKNNQFDRYHRVIIDEQSK